jgi:hypothetical protein
MRPFLLIGCIIGTFLVGGTPAFAVTSTGDARAKRVNDASTLGSTGLVVSINSFDSQHPGYNDLGAAYGPLITNYVSISFDRGITHDDSLASLKVSFTNLVDPFFTGVWNSLINSRSSEYPEYVLSVTNWEYLRFYVRGSGASANAFFLKIEIKEAGRTNDPDYAYFHTGIKYIQINDANTNWTPIVLTNDLTNTSSWKINPHGYSPDPTKIKDLVFVLEGRFNPSSGSFYMDDMAFIDKDQPAQPVTRSSSDQTFLNYLLENNFKFFLHSVHPQTGLVLDRSSFPDLATIAGVGFGLSCWPLAAQFGLISRDKAFALASNVLTTLATAPMGSTYTSNAPSAGQIGVNGFFYHFLDSRTATRIVQTNAVGDVINTNELSTIDTAICAFGIIACRQAMTVTNHYTAQQESQITSLADTILSRIDWPFMLQTNGARRMYMAWKPEPCSTFVMPHPSGVGYVSSTNNGIFTWDFSTDEALLIAIAGMAAADPSHRLPETFAETWCRVMKRFSGYDVTVTWPGAAFTYQFANLWLPLDQLPPDNYGMDWWLNAYKAARCNYAFSMDPVVRAAYSTFDGCSFGSTACEDPSGRYGAFGAAPAGALTNLTSSDSVVVQEALASSSTNDPDFVNGTLAPYGAACFIEFMPQETLLALRHYVFDLGLWHNYYGFPDSFHGNLSQYLSKEIELKSSVSNRLAAHVGLWRSPIQFSIDQGPMVMALGNYLHPGIVHDWVLSNSNVMRVVTNMIASTSEVSVTAKAWVVPDGDTACELMWQAPAFDGTRRYAYTVQNSTNLSSDPWHDSQGSVVWPISGRAWIAQVAETNSFMAYRIQASD